jgi:hypothetical protein
MPPARIRYYTMTAKLEYYTALEAFWCSVIQKYGNKYPTDIGIHNRYQIKLQQVQQEIQD